MFVYICMYERKQGKSDTCMFVCMYVCQYYCSTSEEPRHGQAELSGSARHLLQRRSQVFAAALPARYLYPPHTYIHTYIHRYSENTFHTLRPIVYKSNLQCEEVQSEVPYYIIDSYIHTVHTYIHTSRIFPFQGSGSAISLAAARPMSQQDTIFTGTAVRNLMAPFFNGLQFAASRINT